MFAFILRRILSGLLVLFTVSVMVFALFFYGPGDPALAFCPESRCDSQRLERITEQLNLDDPVAQQYGRYMRGIVAGDEFQQGAISINCPAPCLGVSYKLRIPVTEYLWGRFPATFSVAIGAAVIFLVVGVSIGMLAARKRGTMTDRLLVGGSLLINAIPYYVLALLLSLYLINELGLFTNTGYNSPFGSGPGEGPWPWITGMALPWIALGLTYSTQYARFGRGAMVDALSEDYVRTARAKGLRERTVVVKHAFRAAIVPIVTIFGLDFAILLAGTIFTERVFGIPGIGLAAIDAIGNEDLPIISATVLLAATFIVVANIVVDVLYSVIDPRVRLT